MKRFTKTLLSVAAVSAVSAAMAVSAMAMSATYDPETGTLTFADVNTTGASQTLLVLNNDATTVTETDIVQIDQQDDGTAFATTKVGTLADGTYYIRIGGSDGTKQDYTLTVSSTSVTTKEIIVGDASMDDVLNAKDITFVARKVNNVTVNNNHAGEIVKIANSDATHTIGDASMDDVLNAKDITFVARKVNNVTVNNNHAGEKIEIVVE